MPTRRRTERNVANLIETIGGTETCGKISQLFHGYVAADPILSGLFPKDLSRTTERFALFLHEKLGGPPEYTARRGKTSLRCRHAHVAIGCEQANAWLKNMSAALDALGMAEPARQMLSAYFVEIAADLTDPYLHLSQLSLKELRSYLEQNPALKPLGQLGSGLLKRAATTWNLPLARSLLEFGAEVELEDSLGHDALYHAAGAVHFGREAEGVLMIRFLVENGANVNGVMGINRVTPLHMAARRGSVEIVKTLLLLGADPKIKDKKGFTPLQRAENCRKHKVVELLRGF